jgi:hypothetical protein
MPSLRTMQRKMESAGRLAGRRKGRSSTEVMQVQLAHLSRAEQQEAASLLHDYEDMFEYGCNELCFKATRFANKSTNPTRNTKRAYLAARRPL